MRECIAIAAILTAQATFAQTPSAAHGRAEQAPRCEQSIAEFIDVQGLVEHRSAQVVAWSAAASGDAICAGDVVRVSAFGQARVRLRDDTMLSLDRNTNATFGTPPAGSGVGTLVELLRGLIHVISRDPRSLRFDTPYVNAGLEGTEFTIEVAEQATEVAVIEGTVALSNEHGSLALASGKRGGANASTAPRETGAADPADVLAWTAYVPRIIATPLPAADALPSPAQAGTAAFFSARAAARLALGLVEPATADLAESLRLEPEHPHALALRALLALAEHDRDSATSAIERALASAPDDVPSLLAASYVRQTRGAQTEARAAIDAAAAIEPNDYLVATRRAELLVAAGDASGGNALLERAIALMPDYGRAHAVQGFAYLGLGRSTDALAAFTRAITLDPSLPLARIGLAVAEARSGDIGAARRALEAAVALDPRNAVLRSYVAKTYSAQNRAALSDTQLELAQHFDPLDPTPWLYGAIAHQQANRSVLALWELERAAREPGPATIRSSLSLDEDLAARSIGVGRVYRSLGFNWLAMQRGNNLVKSAPADAGGYQLLADIYSSEPRHQIARINTQYTAQLLRPQTLFPVQPQAAESNLFLVDQLGPSELASSDLGVPFTRNGVRVEASGIGASHDTRGVEVAVAGVGDRVSFSGGYFDYSTDGFRPNNDFSQRVGTALVQYRADDDTSWLFELRSTDIDRGDLALRFERDAFSTAERFDDSYASLRVGFTHRASSATTWLALVSAFDGDTDFVASDFYRLDAGIDGIATDVQRIFAGDQWQFISGFRHFAADRRDVNRIIDAPIPFPPFVFSSVETVEFTQRHSLIYGYGVRHIGDDLDVTLGLEAAELATDQTDMRRTMPRLGLEWRPGDRTQLRATFGEHLQGPLVSKFVIEPSVAPSSVAGFNHYYFGAEGERSSQRALGLEHTFSDRLYAGVESVRRELDTPTTVFEPTTNATRIIDLERSETMMRGYVYWTPTSRIGLAVEYLDDQFDNEGVPLGDGYALLDTQRLPVTLSLFHGPRLNTRLRATYVTQSGMFSDPSVPVPDPTLSPTHAASEEFWVADLELGYRLANRRGMLSLIVANLFDETFRFQDADPENPRIMPERVVSLRFTLAR